MATLLNAQTTSQHVIVVYGDSKMDYFSEILAFSRLLEEENRPILLRGSDITYSPPESATLVWFGDLSHLEAEVSSLPADFEYFVNSLGQKISDAKIENGTDGIVVGQNCFFKHLDGGEGLPRFAANFSGRDSQSFCKGLTISHVLRADVR